MKMRTQWRTLTRRETGVLLWMVAGVGCVVIMYGVGAGLVLACAGVGTWLYYGK